MKKIGILAHKLVYGQTNCYNRSLKKGLKKEKVRKKLEF